MDMESRNYKNNLAQLVKDNKVPVVYIDDAVKRILQKKFELGLFDDPYRFCNAEREQAALNNPEHAKAARLIASKSIVLLKNENQLLPLSKETKTIAFIGLIPILSYHNGKVWKIKWVSIANYFMQKDAILKVMTDPVLQKL